MTDGNVMRIAASCLRFHATTFSKNAIEINVNIQNRLFRYAYKQTFNNTMCSIMQLKRFQSENLFYPKYSNARLEHLVVYFIL